MVHNTPLKEAEGPNTLKYYVNEQNVDEDEAQGENPYTNRKTVWYESDMFKHIVALNTYTESFLV